MNACKIITYIKKGPRWGGPDFFAALGLPVVLLAHLHEEVLDLQTHERYDHLDLFDPENGQYKKLRALLGSATQLILDIETPEKSEERVVASIKIMPSATEIEFVYDTEGKAIRYKTTTL